MKRFFFWNRPGEGQPSASVGPAEEAPGLLTGDPAQDERFVQILLESIADVSSDMELAVVLEGIAAKSLSVTQAERAVVFLGPSFDELKVGVAQDKAGAALSSDLQYSRSVVRRSLDQVQPVRSVVQSDEEALELGQSVFDLKLRAVMCAPLIAKENVLGAIYVDSRAARREFSARDLALFGALTAQLSIAVENARLYADSLEKVKLQKDVEIAHRIQRHLLPPVPASLPGVDIALRYIACEAASGDTYDFLPIADGKLAVVIGDVTGHGVGAALLTHTAQAGLRSYLELLDDPGEVVCRLNNRLVEGVETGNFMSLALIVLDAHAGAMHYVNAGHAELWLIRDGELQTYGKTGMVLGVVADSDYSVRGPVPLQPGDLLFFRTDGVEESMNSAREVFGEERLKELLIERAGDSAEAILKSVDDALAGHRAELPPEDDVTMIAIKVVRA